jgi:hypothetical protein
MFCCRDTFGGCKTLFFRRCTAVRKCLSNLRRAWHYYLTVRLALFVRYSQGRGFLNLVG